MGMIGFKAYRQFKGALAAALVVFSAATHAAQIKEPIAAPVPVDGPAAPTPAVITPGEIPKPTDPAVVVAPAATPLSYGDCVKAAASYATGIETFLSSNKRPLKYSFVAYCGALGAIIRTSNADGFGRVGDPIFYAHYGPKADSAIFMEPTKCNARQGGPVMFDSGAVDVSALHTGNDNANVWNPPAEFPTSVTCFNTDAQIRFHGKVGKDKTVDSTTTVTQYERYTFTAQIGVVFTDTVGKNYAVDPNSSGDSVIRDAGPSDSGPEYFASVVVYGAPHYLPALWGGQRYYGRDIVNDDSWLDRTGLLLGFGLEKPKDRFLAGLSFEVVNGINLVGAHRWARLSTLDGFSVGDEFTSTADKLPKKDVWDTQWVVGLSIDGRYLTRALSSK